MHMSVHLAIKAEVFVKFPIMVFELQREIWYFPFILYYGSALLLFTNILTGHYTSRHQALLMYKISDLYLLPSHYNIL